MTPSPEDHSALSAELLSFLRSRLGENISLVGELNRLQGGYDTDTFAFTIANAPTDFPNDLVLRHFQSARESDRVIKESTIQNAAYDAGYPVPKVPIDLAGYLLQDRPFIVMERLPGSALGSLVEDRSILMQLPVLIAKLQIGLHQINSSNLQQQLLDKEVAVDRMTPQSLLDRISEITTASGDEKLSEIHKWLTENWPEQPDAAAICHGDFHPNNILYADGKITGLIDWGNVLFTHAEYDVAVTHLALSIGPIDMEPSVRDEMQPLIDSLLSEYLDIYRSERPLNNDLVMYYGALRSAHAYAKVTGARLGVDLSYINDGYAWTMPQLFTQISRVIESATGISLDRN